MSSTYPTKVDLGPIISRFPIALKISYLPFAADGEQCCGNVSFNAIAAVPDESFPKFPRVGVPVELEFPVGITALPWAALCAFKGIVVEEEDREWICFLGGNSFSRTKKYQGSNSSDGGNIGDGVKIAGEVIGSW
ncbi:hypothetical protein Tco_0205701 [Tanacetum coccineum]